MWTMQSLLGFLFLFLLPLLSLFPFSRLAGRRTVRSLAAALVAAAVAITAGSVRADATVAPGCAPVRPARPGTTEQTLPFGGLDRRYELTIPKGYDGRRPAPLLLNLHGFGGTGRAQNQSTDMPAEAGTRGYVVVAPDGGPLKIPLTVVPGAENAGQYEGMPFWNIFSPGVVDFGPPHGQNLGLGSSAVGADDVGFTTQLLDTLSGQLCLDANRLYVTGMSNGAGMATTLGCNLADRLAAIAPVSGVNLTGTCPGDKPISVLAIHGDADHTVPYGGNGLLGFHFGNPSVPERMTQWAARDHCRPRPTTTRPHTGLTVERWHGCAPHTDVELYTIARWGHQWPRASSANKRGRIDATQVVLNFFDAHRRSPS
jgi:polyhydroxybutyrate depolymerase